MGIRKQLYTWELHGDNTSGKVGDSTGHYPTVGVEHSILYGDFGYVQPARQTGLVREDEFIVLEKIASTPGISPYEFSVDAVGNLTRWTPNIFVNIIIDTTNYYQDPQNVWSSGVSGFASPYPRNVQDEPYYSLWPPVYVLPDQTVDVRYTLFNGTDAMIARKLMNLGIPVNVGTVENYRRLLLKSKGLETETFDFYLETMRQERKRSRKARKLQGVATNNDYESDL
jgi:hypothetical protein